MYYGGRLAPFFERTGVHELCLEMVNHGGERMTHLVKINTPVGHQPFTEDYIPGALRASITKKLTTFSTRGGRMVYESGAFTDVSYAPYVENGTGLYGEYRRKYLIVPKKPGGWLSWIDQQTGQRIFARKVMHPGSPGSHMFEFGAAITEQEFGIWSQRMVQTWARRQERRAATQVPIMVTARL
jgi:hypothetical protein